MAFRALAIAAVLAAPALARSQSRLTAAPELSVGAGYDDNLFLDPSLSGAAPPAADAVVDVEPSLVAGVAARGQALTLAADYLERITVSHKDIRNLALRLEWRTPRWHGLSFGLAPLYTHYDADLYPDNTFELAGGEAALRFSASRVSLLASYTADGRVYTFSQRNGQLDFDQEAIARVRVQAAEGFALALAYRFFDVVSNNESAVLERHRVDVGFEFVPTWRVAWTAGYSLWAQTLPNGGPPTVVAGVTEPGGPRSDLAHAVSTVLTVRPLRWLALFARYQFILSTSDQPNGRYQLDEIVAGAAVGWTLARERTPPPPPLVPSVNGREVTFRARARPGAVVAVVGDWNDWTPAPLSPVGGDRYEATLSLPPGRHTWALSIDGAVVTPPEATGFVDDGFGGRNAIVDVQ